MNDEEFEKQCDRIRSLSEKWCDVLGLGQWTLHLHFEREAAPFGGTDGKATIRTPLALTDTDWEYMQASIAWNIPMLPHTSDDQLEMIFVHEMCHVLVNEMRADGDGSTSHKDDLPHEERVCTLVAKALLAARGVETA